MAGRDPNQALLEAHRTPGTAKGAAALPGIGCEAEPEGVGRLETAGQEPRSQRHSYSRCHLRGVKTAGHPGRASSSRSIAAAKQFRYSACRQWEVAVHSRFRDLHAMPTSSQP